MERTYKKNTFKSKDAQRLQETFFMNIIPSYRNYGGELTYSQIKYAKYKENEHQKDMLCKQIHEIKRNQWSSVIEIHTMKRQDDPNVQCLNLDLKTIFSRRSIKNTFRKQLGN